MTMNGKTIPLPSEFTTPPAWTSQTWRGNIGSRLRRYVASGFTKSPDYATQRGARSPDGDVPACGDVRDLPRLLRRERVGGRRDQPRRADRVRRGDADRAVLRGRRQRGRIPARLPGGTRGRPVRARRE